MGKGRKSKPYKDGPRKQMTPAWKQLVLDTLAANKKSKKRPANLAQMAHDLGADKKGIYKTFDPKLGQMSSAYVDDICELLKIPPPMIEATDDPELERDLDVVRALDPEVRRRWVEAVVASVKK